MDSPVRGIGGGRCVYVNMKSLRRVRCRRIAVSIATVVGAAPGDILALRRLRELPDFGERHSALRRTRRTLRKRASRRGRASIIDRPINNLATGMGALARVLADVIGGDNISVSSRNARAINCRAASRGNN